MAEVNLRIAADTETEFPAVEQVIPSRSEELSTQDDVQKALLDIYKDIEAGFRDQYERSQQLMDYWDIFYCKLGPKQFYTGNSRIFVPVVHNAIQARKTRFVNQVFPNSGRYVEVTTQDGSIPHAELALAEHYVRKTRLRTEIMPALMKNGDVEGQYNLYVGWRERSRHVAWKVISPFMIDGAYSADNFDIEDIEEETLVHGAPFVEVLADSDVLVLPFTCDSIDEALENGGSVTILRRWSKAKLEQMISDGEVREEPARSLLERIEQQKDLESTPHKAKEMVDAAGIKGSGIKYLLAYESWAKLNIDGERYLTKTIFGSSRLILSCKRNPYWCDKCPLISAPVDKVQGSFKGRSKVECVADLQYFCNDIKNEGADSASYTLMPVIMTDPLKNPRIGSMQLSLGAIWQTSPADTSIHQFPDLYKSAEEIVAITKNEIMQSLGVNPSMITQVGSKQRQNQAQMAAEAQVEVLTTADAVTVLEEGILTPLITRFIELDHQYRDEKLMVRQYGELGQRSRLEAVPPVQMNRFYQFRWFGVEAARNAQAQQQQIATMNVLMGVPPQHLRGYEFDAVPIISQLVENVFGPRIAPQVFKSPEAQMPVPVDQENMLLIAGFEVPIHTMDDDMQHIQSHTQLMQTGMTIEGVQPGAIKKIQAHIFQHMQQAQRKQQAQQQQAQAAMQAQQQAGVPGRPGGAGPGVAGTPRPGAMPQAPRGGQNPPGAIAQDQMRDPSVFPRRM